MAPDAGVVDEAPVEIAALVDEHHATLYRYAFRLTGSALDAEDLTQQTFLAAQVKLAQLRDAKSSRGWLFTILRNCYLKSLRRRWPVTAGSLELDLNGIPDELPHTEEIDRDALQAALDELPPEFKVVLMLFYFEGCSYKEIAQRLRLPTGTVMSRLSRAKGHLRARLLEAEMAGEPRRAT
jgi:RNA polymerase sigma-70 factor (ECF subfamily)